MTLETYTDLFAWMTAINVGLLLVTTLALWAMRDWVSTLHGRMFGIPAETARIEIYRYLATFKIAVIVLNLVPYLALRIVG